METQDHQNVLKDKIAGVLTTKDGWDVSSNEDTVSVTNEDGVDAFIYIGSQQVTVISPLFSVKEVPESDRPSLNELILKTHMLSPLTSMAINKIGGEDYYVAFGALSVDSKTEVILEEVEVLFDNIPELLESYWLAEDLK